MDIKQKIIIEYQDNKDYYDKENSEAEKLIKEFKEEFSPEKLKQLQGEELIKKVFGGKTNKSMFYSLNYKLFIGTEFKHSYGLWFNDGWYIFDDNKDSKVKITLSEAVEIGIKIINILLLYDKYIKKMLLENNKIDFLKLIENVKNDKEYNEINFYFESFLKYFYMIYPNQFIYFYYDAIIDNISNLLKIDEENYYKKYEYIIQFIRDIQKENENITNFIFCKIISKFLNNKEKSNELSIDRDEINNLEEFLFKIGIKEEEKSNYCFLFHFLTKGKFEGSFVKYQNYDSRKPHKEQFQITFFQQDKNSYDFIYLGIFEYKKENNKVRKISTNLENKIKISFKKKLTECGFGSKKTPYKNANDINEIMNYKMNFFNGNVDNLIDYDENGKIKGIEENKNPLNQILYGPAGTGKTYNTVIKSLEIINERKFTEEEKEEKDFYKEKLKEFNELKNKGQIEFITFHQSYSYEDFIEGIKPNLNNDNISYKIEDGIFKKFVNEALKNLDKNYVFIIDEINRGNISKIFGELITLIEEDKRNENWSVKLPYSNDNSNDNFYIPKNVYIIGTMNTSDRSIASIDIALRRRFKFIEMMPNSDLLKDKYNKVKEIEGINLKDLLDNINKKITILLDRDHQIGHSYFIKVENIEDLKDIWFNEIIPLLNEYFYNDFEKLKLIIPDFIEEIKDNPFKNNSDYSGTYYEFIKEDSVNNDKFKEYLNNIINNVNKNNNNNN